MSTASALEREIQCPASAVLSPAVHESGEAADRGNAIHVFARSCIAGTPRSIALAAVPSGPWRETCEQIDITILTAGLTKVRAEVAYRITTHEDADDEVRELGINLGRRYPPRAANDTDGTNDLEGQEPISGIWSVTDIKTGFWPVTACEKNPQMRFHARALMFRHGVDKVKARIAYVAVDGQISWDVYVFSRLELDTFADELIERKERIARANEALRSGGRVEVHADEKWCRWCPAQVGCPKYTSLANAMLGELRETHATWGTMTPDQRSRAFLMAAEAKDLAEQIVESLKFLARSEPIALPHGKVLRETSSGVRVVNADKPARKRRVA